MLGVKKGVSEAMIEFLFIFLKSIATLGVLVGGLWALTKYVIERGLVPAAEFDLDCNVIGEKDEHKIIEVTVHILNKGSSILVTENISLILKTICTNNTLSLYEDNRKLGRLIFPNSLSKDLTKKQQNKVSKDLTKKQQNKVSQAFTLVPYNTFVQPSVDQKYPFVTFISRNVEFLYAQAEFQYAQKPTPIQSGILWVSRRIGLIQYTLQHIYEPHRVQRVFNVTTSSL